MNKNRKSKLVLFSVIGLAAVSIGTVGFATWMVGVQKTNEVLTVKANVDNTLNESIFLEATTSNTPLIIAESAVHTKAGTDILGAKVDGDLTDGNVTVSENALKFSFTTLQYSVGNGAANPTKLHIALAPVETNTINKVTVNKLGQERNGESWTYLAFDKTYIINGKNETQNNIAVTEADKGSYKLYTFNTKEFTLDWGSFFGGKSPVTYYNEISKKDNYKSASAIFKLADNVYNELTAMKSALKSGNLSINVSLEYDE